MRSLADVKSWLSTGLSGSAETAAAPFWRMLRHYRPDIKIVVVRRPVGEVVDSLVATGVVSDREQVERDMRKLDNKLQQIAKRVPGVLSVQFKDLVRESVCKKIFEFCLPFRHDNHWWAAHDRQNMQVNLPAMFRYMLANWPQIKLLESQCRQESRRLMWRGGKLSDADGMMFREESFRDFFDGAQALFKEHALVIGEADDAIFRMNLGLMDRLYNAGALQIVTARSNGRMFGYLMTVLGPGLEEPDLMIGVQTLFYGSPDARGVGARLQKASVEALEARGGRWDIIQKAGHRGSGRRLAPMFKRMGSEEIGQLYRLSIRSA